MLLLAFAIILFFFLVVGAVLFVGCILLPPARRYALSAALWGAAWGPCVVALLIVAGLAVVATLLIAKPGETQSVHASRFVTALGWGYVVAGAFASAIVASAISWLHQAIARRLTFTLFRLYATAVAAGIGSVFGWCLSWWMLPRQVPFAWAWSLLCMVLLVSSFGAAAYRGARALRGNAATKFAWVSPQEFAGR